MARTNFMLCNRSFLGTDNSDMTYADYRLGKAIRALTEAKDNHREWIGSAEFYLFTRMREEEVPRIARPSYMQLVTDVMLLQGKYSSPRLHIPATLLTDDEVVGLVNQFVDLVTSWPHSQDIYL